MDVAIPENSNVKESEQLEELEIRRKTKTVQTIALLEY